MINDTTLVKIMHTNITHPIHGIEVLCTRLRGEDKNWQTPT